MPDSKHPQQDRAGNGWPGLIMPYKGIWPKIHPDAFIAPNAVIIGDVEIGARSSIWFNCVLRGDMNDIRIGEDTNIQDGTIVHIDSRTCGTYVGDRVTVGHMALLHACTIEDDAMIGMQATVMDRSRVEKGAMVAAGALITPNKIVGAGELWGGSPAGKLRNVGEDLQEMMDYIWPAYVNLSHDFVDAGQDLRRDRED